MQLGGEGKPVELAISTDASRVTLGVRDHGRGILLEGQAKIFDCFERLGSARNHVGFGVGLWLARQIIEAHAIQVRSRPGAVSACTVLLPL